jgi:hypothetical protein
MGKTMPDHLRQTIGTQEVARTTARAFVDW